MRIPQAKSVVTEFGHIAKDRRANPFIQKRPSGGPEAEPLLEASEIQGNIIPGFNKDYQRFIFCRISDVRAFRQWLTRTVSDIATLEEVVAFNRLFAALRSRRGKEGTVQATWINIAFSYQGLRKIFPASIGLFDAAFQQGMYARLTNLGETDDASQWLIGGPRNLPDVIIIAASDRLGELNDTITQITQQPSGCEVIFDQMGETQPPPLTGHEHFGYLDGISQPGVRGRLSTNPAVSITPRSNAANPDQGKPGQDLIWPGEFIIGYRDEAGATSPATAWTKNGSFLVFRRYRQDLPGFRSFLQKAADYLAHKHPALNDMNSAKLGAMLMGRWKSGAPLARAPDRDNPLLGRDSCANNNFTFVAGSSPTQGGPGECDDTAYPTSRGDPLALTCPFAAHIRKANPRDDLGALTGGNFNRNRILRRGIPYEDRLASERGLLFVCYQASIERQFEFIIRNWVNDPNFREVGEGCDPIISQASVPRTIAIPVQESNGSVTVVPLTIPKQWVIATGGVYFFAPSITALTSLAN
jgi:Dyp-type peroxidase family